MKNIFTSEKGFTLLEMVISLTLLSVISTGLAYTINTIFMSSDVAVGETVSMRYVQNAGFWITRDIQRADVSSVSTSVEGRFLDLDYYTGSSSTSTVHVYYVISEGAMTRYLGDGSSMTVAQNVVGVGSQTTIENSGGEWTLNIAVSNGDSDTATGVYIAKPRVQ